MENINLGTPLVSILIPYYNDEKFLRNAIESVLNQSYQNFELFLLNHATEDSCREIARSYGDSRIRHIDMEENIGGGSGLLLQKMLDQSSGKYIKILSADDEFRPEGLATLVNYMEENFNNVDFAFGNVEYINSQGKDLKVNHFDVREYFSVDNTPADCIGLLGRGIGFLPWAGAIIKADVLKKIKINKTYMYCFDINLWLALFCKGYKAGYINQLVANYRIYESQASAIGAIDKVAAFDWYEHKTYYKTFFELENLEIAKEVFPESRFIDKLNDPKDIPFFIAHNLFIEQLFAGHSAEYIDDLLNDDDSRKHLEEVFGYGIKEYREDILKIMKQNSYKKTANMFKNYKNKIYSTAVKNLRIRDMAYLFIRRLLHNITLGDLRKKLKSAKKKKYSL